MDLQNTKKASLGLLYRLKLTRKTDNAVLNKASATNNAKIKINIRHWYVSHNSPNLEEYDKLMKQIMNKTPTNLHYPERSVFMKEV